MEILRGILVVLHIVGFGVVFGGALAQMPAIRRGAARITPGILHGTTLLLITGLALVGMIYALGGSPNNAKIGVKLAVLIMLFVIILMNRKKESVGGAVIGSIAGLSALNVCLAVLW